jgi:Pyridoxamine 5'-phosphate oxidase
MGTLVVPPEVEAVFQQVRTCEFTTLAKDGTPITWPTVALYEPTKGRFVITTSIGLPHKAYNVRRTPRVAMLYSNPTGSGLAAPPAVLVQGEAVCPDQIVTQSDELDVLGRLVMVRQPVSASYSAKARDSSHSQARRGGETPAQRRRTGIEPARGGTLPSPVLKSPTVSFLTHGTVPCVSA